MICWGTDVGDLLTLDTITFTGGLLSEYNIINILNSFKHTEYFSYTANVNTIISRKLRNKKVKKLFAQPNLCSLFRNTLHESKNAWDESS